MTEAERGEVVDWLGPVETITSEVRTWVQESAKAMKSLSIDGEGHYACFNRLKDSILKVGREKFPECKWLYVLLLRESISVWNVKVS